MSNDLDKKINRSIRLIQSYCKYHNVTLAYSGGKDSDIVRHLCKLAKVNVQLVHNCTTIDPPYTLTWCKKQGAIIQRPKKTFFELVAKKGLPAMFRRFCCKELKENYIAPYLLLGVRASESVRRAERVKEPTSCFIYTKKKQTEQIMPIWDWTLDDEKNFVEQESLKFHPYYYDAFGKLQLTRRLGCIGCPLQGDRGCKDYLHYPKFLRLLVKAYNHYGTTHKFVESLYNDVAWQLFYSNHKQKNYDQTFHGLFEYSAKEMLEDYFNIDLTV